MTRRAIAFLLAVIATYLVGTILISQFNLARISDMGYPVGVSERWQNSMHDVGGMLDLYLPLVTIALLIAFLVNAFGVMRFFNKPAILYPLAGFTALVAMHLILYAVFGMSPVAPTRTLIGLLSQGLAGAVGGYIYWRVASSQPTD